MVCRKRGILGMEPVTRQTKYFSPEECTRDIQRHKKPEKWNLEMSMETQKSESVTNNIMAQTSKPKLVLYLHAALLHPTKESLLKSIKQGFLMTWPDLTKIIINRHIWKIKEHDNGTPVHEKKRPEINQSKTSQDRPGRQDQNKCSLWTTVDPSTKNQGKVYSEICGQLPTTSSRGNKYIYVNSVYDCNSILATAMKNRSDK